jgi:DNA-directed RNA polymerase beta subunit
LDLHEALGESFLVRSTVDGTVEKVDNKSIVVSGVEHQIFDHYPMQAKVAFHHFPVVKVGDKVKNGDLLADSNYSKDGRMTLGVNLRSAYTPWKNATNFEDSVVISETAAKKLTSEHMHRLEIEIEAGVVVDKQMFMAQFPTKLTVDNAKFIGVSGVIKEGTKVQPGWVLVAAVKKTKFNENDTSVDNLARIHKTLMRPYKDAAVYWDEIFEGEVYRVLRNGDRIEVHIKTLEPMQVGDKISMSSAAKGTV